jgi:hypothetical protein
VAPVGSKPWSTSSSVSTQDRGRSARRFAGLIVNPKLARRRVRGLPLEVARQPGERRLALEEREVAARAEARAGTERQERRVPAAEHGSP